MRWTFHNTSVDRVGDWWDKYPCNVTHSLAPISSLRFSREVSEKRFRAEPHNKTFAQHWKYADKVVLEVGCGIGTDTLEFAREGAAVYATDISENSLTIARVRAEREHVNHHIQFLQWNAEDRSTAPFVSPDLIYSYGVLHHMPHPYRAITNLRHAAKPTTELRIMLYHKWSLKALKLGFTNRHVARGSEANANTPVTYTFSKRQARKLLWQCGWVVTSMQVRHIFMYDVQSFHHGEWKLALPWRWLPPWACTRLSHLVGWHLLIVAKPRVD